MSDMSFADAELPPSTWSWAFSSYNEYFLQAPNSLYLNMKSNIFVHVTLILTLPLFDTAANLRYTVINMVLRRIPPPPAPEQS